MATRYHITKRGEPGLCRAAHACPLGGPDEHFDNPKDAVQAYEQKMNAQLMPEAMQKDSLGLESLNKDSTRDEAGQVDLGVPADDTGLIRKVDLGGSVRYHNSEGQLHREDGPAYERPDGTRQWYLDGQLHREDGPAIERADGTREWYLDGKRHREDGPAYERPDGTREWYLDGKFHREDGPAIEYPYGTREWLLNGQFHREDGPAIEWANGSRYWYLDGKRLSEDEFEARKPAAHQG